MYRVLVFAVLCLLCLPTLAPAAVIHVPGNQPTIQAGIDAAVSGDIVLVADGTYTGVGNTNLTIDKEGITLRSESGPLACIIDCEYIGYGVLFDYPCQNSVLDGFTVTHANAGAIQTNPGAGYPTTLKIANCRIITNGLDYNWGAGGINCNTDSSVVITDCLIAGCIGYLGGGIHCWDADVTIINSLIFWNYATEEFSWPYEFGYGAGIYGEQFADITVINSTITDNSAGDYGSNGGGIHLREDCTISVIDSIIWDNEPTQITLSDGSTATVTYSDVDGGYTGIGNIDADPRFATGPEGDYYLSQTASGQLLNSPCVNTGSDQAMNICYGTPQGTTCMSQLSTRTDLYEDTGVVNMGYHYLDLNTVGASFNCTPDSGTVPFSTWMSLELTNHYAGLARRIAGHIDVTLASDQTIGNWRAGYTVIAAGDSYTTSWNQTIPALGTVIGDNLFRLVSEDVTPTPYNQPPYPSAGDTDTSACTVTGIAP